MLRRIEFETEKVGAEPTDKELEEAIKIASEENVIVIIHWYMKWSGWYKVRVKGTDTVESCRERMPKVYGL